MASLRQQAHVYDHLAGHHDRRHLEEHFQDRETLAYVYGVSVPHGRTRQQTTFCNGVYNRGSKGQKTMDGALGGL